MIHCKSTTTRLSLDTKAHLGLPSLVTIHRSKQKKKKKKKGKDLSFSLFIYFFSFLSFSLVKRRGQTTDIRYHGEEKWWKDLEEGK